MASILSGVGSLVSSATTWATEFLSLFFTYSTGAEPTINGISALGLFCVVLPLVGLGIGIIRRLVNIRA